MQADLHQGRADRDASARQKRRFHRAGEIGFVDPGEPLALLGLRIAKPRSDWVQRVGHFSLLFDREREPLAEMNPIAMRNEYVMEERTKFPISSSNGMPPDRIYY